jgi:phosphoribosyl-AMP cyclohydrolase
VRDENTGGWMVESVVALRAATVITRGGWLSCRNLAMLYAVRLCYFATAQVLAKLSTTNPNLPAFSHPTGLVTAITQDAETGQVLMVAHMNREAWEETLRTGKAVYFSRSRGRLWRKGEESGNFQNVRAVFVDCDGDAVLLKVEQIGGAACHEGYPSCFFRQVTPDGLTTVAERVFDPAKVYHRSE